MVIHSNPKSGLPFLYLKRCQSYDRKTKNWTFVRNLGLSDENSAPLSLDDGGNSKFNFFNKNSDKRIPILIFTNSLKDHWTFSIFKHKWLQKFMWPLIELQFLVGSARFKFQHLQNIN